MAITSMANYHSRNYGTEDISVEMSDYPSTDKQLLVIETLRDRIELIITKEQLEQLRMAVQRTNLEAEEEYQWYKKNDPDMKKENGIW